MKETQINIVNVDEQCPGKREKRNVLYSGVIVVHGQSPFDRLGVITSFFLFSKNVMVLNVAICPQLHDLIIVPDLLNPNYHKSLFN